MFGFVGCSIGLGMGWVGDGVILGDVSEGKLKEKDQNDSDGIRQNG